MIIYYIFLHNKSYKIQIVNILYQSHCTFSKILYMRIRFNDKQNVLVNVCLVLFIIHSYDLTD
jgi:hypothetical protein